jgi:hypothetical protein
MAYLNDIWSLDPNSSKLYKLVNDQSVGSIATLPTPAAICVDINRVDVWVVSRTGGTVSQFNNGLRVKDIAVGKNPMGIAQAPDGSLYVPNYSSNTVSKIVNGEKVKDIVVGMGPRGVCVTPDGDVYVSNYLSSTVSRIVNDSKVKDIAVGRNPYGICSTKSGAVYVACCGADIVTKIKEGTKILDINVGKLPMAICLDKDSNLLVTIFNDNIVSKIVNDKKIDADIPVGKGPFGIATTPDGYAYVFNYLDTTMSKLYGGKKVSDITLWNNPSGFGDFTGYQAYMIYQASTGGSQSSTIISYNNLDDNLKKIIDSISSGGAGITLPIDDAKVSHNDPNYPTVDAALDYLLYKAPQITSFTNNVNVVEMGTTVTDVVLNWTLNKTVTSQNIAGVGDIAVGTTTKELTPLMLTSDASWTLTVSDGTNSVTKTTGVKFENKAYWGTSASTTLDNAGVLALNNAFATNYDMDKTLDATGGKYMYFAVPTSFGLDTSKFKVGGLANSDWVKTTIDFTNASGYKTSYDVFRSGNIQTGSAIEVVIE